MRYFAAWLYSAPPTRRRLQPWRDDLCVVPNDSRTGRRTSLQNECAPNKNAMSDFFRLSVLKRNEVFSELLHNWNKTDVFV